MGAVEDAPVGELRDKVLAYLAYHPDGTKLTELEEEFGAARIQIAKVIRELIDNKKVEKHDLLYFAILTVFRLHIMADNHPFNVSVVF